MTTLTNIGRAQRGREGSSGVRGALDCAVDGARWRRGMPASGTRVEIGDRLSAAVPGAGCGQQEGGCIRRPRFCRGGSNAQRGIGT